MSVRHELVASAAQFLQEPNVAVSSLDSRIAFLRSKNLTEEEIHAALSQAGQGQDLQSRQSSSAPVPATRQGYYPQQGYSHHAPPPVPQRDWRDWFIMATVMGGVGYGLYELGKRYVAPLISPPTPERLERDMKTVEEQFEQAFTLVEQVAKDTEALKAAEKERTERLDTVLAELERTIQDLKSSNRRRDDDSQRVRDEVQSLKSALPKSMESHKAASETRLRELNTELQSLKTLITRISASKSNSPPPAPPITSAASPSSMDKSPLAVPEVEQPTPTSHSDSAAALLGASGSTTKAAIPAWQLAMMNSSQ